MKKTYTIEEKRKMTEERKERVKELTDRLERGIMDMFTDGTYTHYLKAMASFHDYSLNNLILIHMQMPNATRIAGFQTWKKLGRSVKKGEKAITILAPVPFKTKEKEKDDNGNDTGNEIEISGMYFRTMSVFDITQTEGKEIDIVKDLDENLEDCDTLIDAIIQVSPYHYDFDPSISSCSYYDSKTKTVVINTKMSDADIIKHMITEQIRLTSDITDETTKNIIAESAAYVICSHYGIDTSSYSFGQIAKWSEDKELKELKDNLKYIKEISSEIMKKLDETIAA